MVNYSITTKLLFIVVSHQKNKKCSTYTAQMIANYLVSINQFKIEQFISGISPSKKKKKGNIRVQQYMNIQQIEFQNKSMHLTIKILNII